MDHSVCSPKIPTPYFKVEEGLNKQRSERAFQEMLRIRPSKIQLKADDLKEYEQERARWVCPEKRDALDHNGRNSARIEPKAKRDDRIGLTK